MNGRVHVNGREARHGRTLLATLLCMAAVALLPFPAAAQSTDQVLAQRRLEYRAAKAAYESARSALRVLSQQFTDALDQVSRARERDPNGAAVERARAQAQDRAIPYGAQEERVAETLQTLDDARQALIDVVTVRLEQLLAQMDAVSSAQQRAQLNTIWGDLDNELRALERESGQGLRLEPVVMPEITFDPRDGPAELRFKAELLERKAAVTDTTILDTDDQIRKLNDRIRMERQRRDLEANLNRFDDTRLPVVTAQPSSERPAAPDSTSAGATPLTLEERVRALRGYREQLVDFRDQLLIRARTFRQSIRQVTS